MVSNQNGEYIINRTLWDSNRDAYDGQQKIKDAGTKYLPMLGYHRNAGEDGLEAYEVYKQNAVWFDATHRTVNSSIGLIFRKPPFIQGGPQTEKYKEDFTIDNRTLASAAQECALEAILQGRVGLLVSYPDIDVSDLTQKEVDDQNIHAYSAIYKTEDIINWKLKKVNGKMIPVLVVLQELIDKVDGDQFETGKDIQYRVLELDEQGFYKQSIYKDSPGETVPLSETYPLKDGQRLDFIPFYPITPEGVSWDIVRSPIQGVTDLNIAHYRNSALYESALVITGSPTTVLKGYQSDTDKSLVLGGNNAITLPTDGDAKFLEFTGKGLGEIEGSMNTKKKEMAVLGLRLLSSEQNVNEGAETASIHQVGEQSVLAAISNSVSDAITTALQLMIEWDDPKAKTKKVKVTLNKDFSPQPLTANDLNALTVMNKSLVISDQELFDILKKGEIIPADMTFVEHQKQIRNSMYYDMFMSDTSDQDFTKNVDYRRLTDPENPGDANAPKQELPTDAGGSNEG